MVRGLSSRRHRRDSLRRGPKRRRRAAPVERVLEEPELLDDALVGRRDVAVGPLAVVAPRLSTIFLGHLCGNQICCAFALNRRFDLNAIDAEPARWRGPDTLVDFHTGRHAHGLAVQQLREEDAERDPVGHVRQRARSIQVGDARGVGDLLGRPRAHADVATWRGPGRLRPRPGFGRRRRRGCAVVRVPVRTPTLSPLRCRAVDAMTPLLTASESARAARRSAARFRSVERSWVAAGASRRPPRGAHFEPRRRRGRLAATEVLLAALVFRAEETTFQIACDRFERYRWV